MSVSGVRLSAVRFSTPRSPRLRVRPDGAAQFRRKIKIKIKRKEKDFGPAFPVAERGSVSGVHRSAAHPARKTHVFRYRPEIAVKIFRSAVSAPSRAA